MSDPRWLAPIPNSCRRALRLADALAEEIRSARETIKNERTRLFDELARERHTLESESPPGELRCRQRQ